MVIESGIVEGWFVAVAGGSLATAFRSPTRGHGDQEHHWKHQEEHPWSPEEPPEKPLE